MGENHAGMYKNDRPFSTSSDCWIGKSDKNVKFDISTNHLHYDKEEIGAVMKPGFKKIGIIREPESQFISSFSFYHGGIHPLTQFINPDAAYHESAANDSIPIYKKIAPTTEDLEFEMDKFLKEPFKILDMVPLEKIKRRHNRYAHWIWMATVRPQLLYYGYG